MTITIPGYSSLTGTPVAILKLLEEARYMNLRTGPDYINSVVQMVWISTGIGLKVTGTTYEERAESLLRAMAEYGLITIKE